MRPAESEPPPSPGEQPQRPAAALLGPHRDAQVRLLLPVADGDVGREGLVALQPVQEEGDDHRLGQPDGLVDGEGIARAGRVVGIHQLVGAEGGPAADLEAQLDRRHAAEGVPQDADLGLADGVEQWILGVGRGGLERVDEEGDVGYAVGGTEAPGQRAVGRARRRSRSTRPGPAPRVSQAGGGAPRPGGAPGGGPRARHLRWALLAQPAPPTDAVSSPCSAPPACPGLRSRRWQPSTETSWPAGRSRPLTWPPG